MRLSHATIRILAKSGDQHAKRAVKAWMDLVDYQLKDVVIEARYIAKHDTVEVGLQYTPEV